MPTSPVNFVLRGCLESETGAATNLMLCGYSSLFQTFSSNLVLNIFNGHCVHELRDNTTVNRGAQSSLPVATGVFTLGDVSSLWERETELGLLTAGWGSGSGSELLMTAAVRLMGVRAKKGKKNV